MRAAYPGCCPPARCLDAQSPWATQRTFPDCQVAPASFKGAFQYNTIPDAVLLQFLLPERDSGTRLLEQAAIVPMPKTSMHMNCGMVLRQHQIWSSGHLARMQPKSKSHPVQRTANQALRLGVAGPDAGHHPAAGLPVDYVRQLSSARRQQTDPAE